MAKKDFASVDDALNEAKSDNKIMPLMFLMDCSSSMEGSKIQAVNSFFDQLPTKLEEKLQGLVGVDFKVAVMRFDDNVDWITGRSMLSPSDLKRVVLKASGCTAVGKALTELNSKLNKSSDGYLIQSGNSKYYTPAIIILSDGAPTDNWKKGLEKLEENVYFMASRKRGSVRAVAVGDDANKDVLAQITGNIEFVVEASKANDIIEALDVVTMTATMNAQAKPGAGSGDSDDPTC